MTVGKGADEPNVLDFAEAKISLRDEKSEETSVPDELLQQIRSTFPDQADHILSLAPDAIRSFRQQYEEQYRELLDTKYKASNPGRSNYLFRTYAQENPESPEGQLYNKLLSLQKLIKLREGILS